MITEYIVFQHTSCGRHLRGHREIDVQAGDESLYRLTVTNLRYYLSGFNQPVGLRRRHAKGIQKLPNAVICIEKISVVLFLIQFHKNKKSSCQVRRKRRLASAESGNAQLVFASVPGKRAAGSKIILPQNRTGFLQYVIVSHFFRGKKHIPGGHGDQDTGLMTAGFSAVVGRQEFAVGDFSGSY